MANVVMAATEILCHLGQREKGQPKKIIMIYIFIYDVKYYSLRDNNLFYDRLKGKRNLCVSFDSEHTQ